MDSFIQLNVGVGGEKVDVEKVTVGANANLTRSRIQLSGANADEIARVQSETPDGVEQGLIVRPLPRLLSSLLTTTVAASLTAVQLIGVNNFRKTLEIFNHSRLGFLYYSFGPISSLANCANRIAPMGSRKVVVDPEPIWPGAVFGIWTMSDDGSAQITEGT